MARRSARAWGARLAAPAAFLLAVTVAVLLVRSALRDPDDGGSKTVSVSTRATTTAAAAKRTTPARTQPARPRARYYAIESGDTFGTVAAKFGTTVAALQTLNPDVSSNALVIGQRIRVR